jgi:pimeloyl-ACP methyl ester carboxylesterase
MKREATPQQAPVATGVINGTAYSVYGAGEPVVLVHGVGMEQAVWTRQLACLASEYQVIVYDLLGHGASQDPPEDARLAHYAQQLKILLDHLEIESAAIVGQSMGALVTLEFALTYPERTRKIATVNAVFMRTSEEREAVLARARTLREVGVAATLDSTIERWFGNPVPVELQADADLVAGFMKRTHPAGYARSYQLFASADAVHAEGLAGLAVPALFMTGEFDPNSSPGMSEAMARRAPYSSVEIIEGARHMMVLTSAERVNQALLAFLKKPHAVAATE